MNYKFVIWLLAPFLGFSLTAITSNIITNTSDTYPEDLDIVEIPRQLELVAALGQISPSGEIRRLAAPISGFGGTPRISELLVDEGDPISKGQILAVFDNKPQTLSDIAALEARINTLNININMKETEVARYQLAVEGGAASLVLLDQKIEQLVKLNGDKEEALGQMIGLKADLEDCQLISPIDGMVLRVFSREGERPGAQGVLEIGANNQMEAIIEVYESDINRIRIGQSVQMTSENGGFSGSLYGIVKRISPQVRQREVLSTDPTGDADARIVEVLVSLDQESSQKVSNLTGMKVIAKFE